MQQTAAPTYRRHRSLASPARSHSPPDRCSPSSSSVLFAILDHSDRMATMAHPLFVPSAIANFLAYCLLLLALVAVYEWQARRAGVLGLIGFIAALIGMLFMTGDMWFEAFTVPWLGDVAFEVFAKVGGLLKVGAASTYVLFSSAGCCSASPVCARRSFRLPSRWPSWSAAQCFPGSQRLPARCSG